MIQDLSERVVDWHTSNGGFCAVQGHRFHALRLLHEAVELCLASGANDLEIEEVCRNELAKHIAMHGRERTIVPARMFGEVADVAILLEIIAHYLGLSIDDAVYVKLDVLLGRKWFADDFGVLWRRKDEEATP